MVRELEQGRTCLILIFIMTIAKASSTLGQRLSFRQIVKLYYHRQFDANANAENGLYTHFREWVVYPFSGLMQHLHRHNVSILMHTQTLTPVWMSLKANWILLLKEEIKTIHDLHSKTTVFKTAKINVWGKLRISNISFSSFSVWVKKCETLDLSEEAKENLDTYIDELYDQIDKGTRKDLCVHYK